MAPDQPKAPRTFILPVHNPFKLKQVACHGSYAHVVL